MTASVDRRQMAERVALGELAEAGDRVAVAMRKAVREATTVEITPELVASFSRDVFDRRALTPEFLLVTAYRAAGFEVVS